MSPSQTNAAQNNAAQTNAGVVFDPDDGLGLREVSTDAPRRGEVRVEVRAAGLCYSDLHVIDGHWPTDRRLVMGHEAAGVVIEVGEAVSTTAVGDHVVLSWFAPCRICRDCIAGQPWLCQNTKALDNTMPDGSTRVHDHEGEGELWPYLGLGAFTREITVPETAVVVVPEALPFDVGALLGCSITTGVGAALNTAAVRPGQSAVVVGCGGVGLSTVIGLRLAGADPIVAVDISDERLAVAARLGATATLNAATVDVACWCQTELGGVDFAFEAIGSVPVIDTLQGMLGAGGAAVIVGMTSLDASATYNPFELADRGQRILGCNYGSSNGHLDIPMLARLYLSGSLPLDQLVGRTRPLSEIAEAVDDLRSGTGLRTILIP